MQKIQPFNYSRSFNAPRALVYAVHSDPEHVGTGALDQIGLGHRRRKVGRRDGVAVALEVVTSIICVSVGLILIAIGGGLPRVEVTG